MTLTTLILLTTLAAEPAAPVPTLTKVDVYPTDVALQSKRDRQSLVVMATYSNGVTKDVTAEAEYKIADGKICKVEKQFVYPTADGKTEITVGYQGRTMKLPVAVKDAAKDRPISFRLDVMPIFMKAGCNSGTCHGAARGKDGFRLSLFGYDPDGDHHRLTREFNGRRVNVAIPDACMVVEKSLGEVPHTGGKRYDKDSELNKTLVEWLEAGAPNDPPTIATPISMEIMPKQAVLEGKDATQRMTVRAKYSDGTMRDVTKLALFLSNNDTSAAISPEGVVKAGERGEAFVMARFATFTVGSQVIVVPKGDQFVWPNTPENNYIDTLVNDKLKKLRMAPSELCTDDVFLRRVYLDVVGVLPTREEFDRFLADKDPKKRAKLVDELLGRKEFAEVWVMKLAELLQIRTTNGVSYKATLQYFNWLQNRIASNVPMNQIVKELLGANGGVFKNPATNYYQTELDTLKLPRTSPRSSAACASSAPSATTIRSTAGRWTTTTVGRRSSRRSAARQGEDPRETVVFNSGGGEVDPPGRRPGDEAEVPGRRRSRTPPARTAARCSPNGSRRRRTRTSRRTSPTSSGRTSSAAASSMKSTTSASATRPSIRNCSKNSARSSASTTSTSRSSSRTSAPRGRTNWRRRRTRRTNSTPRTSRTRPSAASAPRCCST